MIDFNKKYLLPALFLLSSPAVGQIKLPKLISNGMVLQRADTTNIWGWASPKENIKLSFKHKTYQTTADQHGKWSIKLPPQAAGGPYEMTFTASNKVILKDILFGDVWICSGQSNMELTLDRLIDEYPQEIKAANYPQIRQFLVPDEYNFKAAQEDVSSGTWKSATAENILNFSGVAYFFALDIHKKNKVAVGLINTALGGSPAQAWISEKAIKNFPEYDQELQKFKDDSLIASIEQKDKSAAEAWYNSLNQQDEGLKENWKAAVLNDQDWEEMNIPGYWHDQKLKNVNGAVWFRKTIDIPASMVGKPVKLLLGRIVDADSVFINGQLVGSTSYQYPPRRYLLARETLKKGKNTIAIKVINNSGKGGFVLDKPYQLIAGTDTLSLRGPWKYKLGAKMGITPSTTFVRWKPVGLYNSMIAPLVNYSVKGVMWYQGESNTGRAIEYADLMTTLIKDWRQAWNKPKLPFLYVQLPGFMESNTQPEESNWAELRMQQLQLLKVDHTAMVVALDLGEWNDIHPLNKKDVGKRLALQAEQLVYGNKNIIHSGPLFTQVIAKGNKLVISFTNTGSGLKTKNGGELKHFAIAGTDGKYQWAKAEIKGNKVIVWNDNIPHPVSVRYAWAHHPDTANLYNQEHLPASPFEARVR
ncbi:sialate O-acetylesterase [Pedobacter sp. CAN_A7]|uniref:sialate O-acetylesterase n=1 Tax=Pedobacter sp. CAN_A7 TaxID=2787722 RepID=UPI0018CABE29